MNQIDFESVVRKYYLTSTHDNRYSSYDYCYNYFHTNNDLTKDIEKSCLVLGFYLASWGMFRGSSFILQKSTKHFVPTILYINSLDRSAWKIDVDSYTNENIGTILNIYDGIKRLFIKSGCAHLTLTTKILLGVFGFIPAFDSQFIETFSKLYNGACGFTVVNTMSLICIRNFYQEHSEQIDKLSKEMFTYDFITGYKSNIPYTKAKIIDMYGWQRAL